MHTAAFDLFPLNRLVLFDEARTRDLTAAEPYKSVLAYPEQRTFPLELSSGKATFYPKRFGMQTVVDALRAALEARGVRLLMQSEVHALDCGEGRVRSLRVRAKHGETQIPVSGCVWAAGVPALAGLLGLKTERKPEPPRPTVFVHLLLKHRPRVDDLYYFFCLDAGFSTYRVTCYWNFSSSAVRHGAFPMTVEMFADDAAPAADRETYAARAVRELRRMGVLEDDEPVLWSAEETVPYGFPMCTVRNVGMTGDLCARIDESRIQNMTVIGRFSAKYLFYGYDVLADAYPRILAMSREN